MDRQRGGEAGDPRLLPSSRRGADRGRAVRVSRQDPAQATAIRRLASASCRPRSRATARSSREGVVMMPSYVNIGAWVGPRTMIDTWATVGSCAQIGADVHLSGGVGIGGVLEPVAGAPGDRRGRRVHRLPLHPHRGRDRRRAGRARAQRLPHRFRARDRRHGPGASRAPWRRSPPLRRRPWNTAEGVPRRHVRGRLCARHRPADARRPISRSASTTRCASSASARARPDPS